MPVPVFVIGSSNTDMVVKSDRLPVRGETVIGGTFFMNPGGKGANQAVAAARLGGDVTFVAKLGDDVFGKRALQQLQEENIKTSFVFIDRDHPSGIALIGVDAEAENLIIVAPGANQFLDTDEVTVALESIKGEAIVLLQLEISTATVAHAIAEAHARRLKIILNPAPAQLMAPDLLRQLYLITPNETETSLLTGVHIDGETSLAEAADVLHRFGIPNVMITLGKKGVFVSGQSEKFIIAAPPVNAVDTTAAGDCFNGAVAVALAEGLSLAEAARFGCSAAALSVTRMGAQSSMPYIDEVKALQF